MHTLRKTAFLGALLVPLLSFAQIALNDFSNWSAPGNFIGGDSTFTISSGSANYFINGSPGETDFSAVRNTTLVAPTATNWSLSVSVTYAGGIFSGSTQQFINAGLMVLQTGTTPGVDGGGIPTFNGFMVNSNLYWNGTTTGSDLRTSVIADGVESPDNETRYAVNSVPASATLYINYNAASQTLSGAYDIGGGITAMTTASFDSVNTASWFGSGADTFSIYLMGNSGLDLGVGVGPQISEGDVSFTNLNGSGLTAVPEPSTYAAIAGAAALGLVAWRRRRQVAV